MRIDSTAIVDAHAVIHETVRIGPRCVIDGEVRIGAGSRLLRGVYVTGWTRIEERCTLYSGAIVGHAPQDTKYRGERSFCRLGKGTVVREYATVHRGTTRDSETVVGEEVLLSAGSHVGHNCTVGNKVILGDNVLLAGHCQVGDGVVFGAGGGLHQFTRVGELVLIEEKVIVRQDVIPYGVVGAGGRVVGINDTGLRRVGFSNAELADILHLYRTLSAGQGGSRAARRRVVEAASTAAGRRLVAFVAKDRKRGYAPIAFVP